MCAMAASHPRSPASASPSRRLATIKSITGSHLLVAVGRRPNTDDLGLDKAGIATDKRGYITVDDDAAHQRAGRVGARRRQRPRRVHAHVVERSRDRRRQSARRRAASRQRPHPGVCALHRSAARPRRPDRGRGARERPRRAGRPHADDARRSCARARRDAGLHEGAGRRQDGEDSSAPPCSASRATRSSIRCST